MEECPVTYALKIINGKWKLRIIWIIAKEKVIRFNDLQRRLTGISSLMLAKNLKELESDGLILRRQYNEIPPHVEYKLTALGKKLENVWQSLGAWGNEAKYSNQS